MGQKYASTIFTLLLISICIVVVQEVNLALEVNKQEDLNKNSKEELQQELQERLENKKTRDNIYEDLNLDAFDSTNYRIRA
ncbi:hypothetical protein AN640_05175 [Candidatus Epulonipiscium fishelsonii]|uniref:Uncharacterized protein n=1 Tax=Candidatus Epulonipiscium fishelsonii TaxID=77094 RepID=A0ACC8XIH1_9FIRM|nr:hypothetical protein AN640_05175 [Epulopiscium sp. SCG-D08WGA-EpuloA1]OON90815.1 MAG: hypothetical protein ATN32_03160 [Epulopiscium sp. AS2M-Bin002]